MTEGKRALILVDIQNDFLPGGALAVAGGDEVITAANRLMDACDVVVAMQDWHPPRHGSFASRHPGRSIGDVVDLGGVEQILWPDHCVQGTRGAQLADALAVDRIEKVFRCGLDPNVDSYSGFLDNAGRNPSGLDAFLRNRNVTEVWVVGLATDYCVKYTALDAVRLGFDTRVILEACRGVNAREGDVAAAIEQMKSAGVRVDT